MIELGFAAVLLLATGGTGYYLLCLLGFSFSGRTEEISFSVASGLGILVFSILVLGLAHLLYEPVIYALVAVLVTLGGRGMLPLLAALRERIKSVGMQVHWRSFYFWLIVLTIVGCLLNLLRALVPPHGATDPLAYQLALPKIFLQNHFLSFEPTITGALYPTNMGLLYLVGIALRNGILAQVIHWSMGILCLVALVGFGQRYFSSKVGIWGATIFGFLPVVVLFGPLGYVDVGLGFFQFMAFWALFNWLDRPDWKNLALAGALTGLSMGIKHQGIATAVVGGGIVLGGSLLRRGGMRRVLMETGLYLGLAFALVGPWYVRSFLMAGNPIWPLANDFFQGLPFGMPLKTVAESGSDGGGYRTFLWGLVPGPGWFANYWESMSPLNWTFNPSGGQKAIGVYYLALLPGLLLVARQKKHFLLIGFCLLYYLVLIRFLHMNPRYGLVFFAFLSILCGCVAEGLDAARWKLIPGFFKGGFLVTVFFNLTWSYFLARPVASVAFQPEKRELFLQQQEGNYRLCQFINRKVPPAARILFQGIVKGFYCDRSYLWDHPHQAVIQYGDYPSPEKLLERMKELGITHIARMIQIPSGRLYLGYPQYFTDAYHESFRKRYLKLIYKDEMYVLFEVQYPE